MNETLKYEYLLRLNRAIDYVHTRYTEYLNLTKHASFDEALCMNIGIPRVIGTSIELIITERKLGQLSSPSSY